MSKEKSVEAAQRALANRAGVRRNLLARKARERTATELNVVPLESDFPITEDALRRASSDVVLQPRTIRRAVAQQILRPGDIQPNPKTVVATIVSIVAERGQLSRDELVTEMRESKFSHAAARPQDPAWCKGYVAGAIRQGFLAAVSDCSTTAISERSADPGEAR